MSLASRILRPLDKIRAIPGRLGLHPFTVTVRTNRWSGARVGFGTLTRSNTQLFIDGNQNPKVKQLSNQDAMLSAGVYSNQDFRVGPMTPPFNLGGIAYATLDQAMNPSTEFYFKLTGPGLPPAGAWYSRLRDETDSSLHIYIILRATGVVQT